jgi:hypothetical protein
MQGRDRRRMLLFRLEWTITMGAPLPEAAGSPLISPGSLAASPFSAGAMLVRAEQISAVYKSVPIFCVLGAIGGLILAVAMSREIPTKTLTIWLATLYAAVSYTLSLYFRYTRARPSPEQAGKWGTRLKISLIINSCAWGSAGVLLFRPDFTVYQMILTFSLLGAAVCHVVGTRASFTTRPRHRSLATKGEKL